MNFRGMDLNLIVALDALLTEKSVSLAAERLHITQPAMSNALRRIRERFGDQILVRSSKGYELTPGAQTLLAPVQELLVQVESLLSVTQEFIPATARKTFKLIMSDYCADVLLADLVKNLNLQAPFVRCEVEFLNNKALSRLWAGDVDFCIAPPDLRLIDPLFKAGAFERLEIFNDGFVCLVSNDNPIFEEAITVKDYLQSPHICVRFGDGTVSMDEQVKMQFGLQAAVVVPSVGNLPKMIPGTRLVATVPARLVDGINNLQGIKVMPCPVPIPQVEENLMWHPRANHDPSHAWFRSVIVETAGSLPTPRPRF